MTHRIVFAVAIFLAFTAASSQAEEAPGSNSKVLANALSLTSDPSGSALRAEDVWALPVVELSGPTQLADTIDLTSEPEELYQRMRQGFSMPNINNALVLHHQQWYLSHPGSLRRMVERSSRYLHHIVGELEKRGMPMELALLPMVESAYNPTAYSRSHASGLWQFVPATGKQYKLEQNWWVDERRDIVASTAAALDYLQYIYDLHGDWHLALASYNWGEGAVGRAINKNRANGLPTDYLSLTMPEETRHYVPKLQALKNIFSNPRILANLNIRGVPNRPYFTTVTKTADIDVELAAKLAEMPVQEFVALNPAHNRPVIKSETPMVIPTDKVATFNSNLGAHEESEKPLCSWQAYTLRPGDKLEQVAPRFGMTVANLRAVNGISGKIKIAPGLTLLVAGQEGTETGDTAVASEQPLLAQQPRLPQPDPSPVVTARTHTVAKGETLVKLAQRYGITVAQLKQLNKLRADHVAPGTRLALAAPDAQSKPEATGQRTTLAEAERKHAEPARIEPAPVAAATQNHTVRKGETLVQLASHYGMTLVELKQMNRLRADQVNAGTKLVVAAPEAGNKRPVAGSRNDLAEMDRRESAAGADRRPSLAKADARHSGKGDDAPPGAHARLGSKKPAKLAQYTIRRGDTLVSIARQFKVEKDDLLRWNRIQANDIKAGQTLTIQLVQNTL